MQPNPYWSNARVTLLVASTAGPQKRIGQWVEAGEVVGRGPGLWGDVRAPVSGVLTRITPTAEGCVTLVLERRRDYEDMDD